MKKRIAFALCAALTLTSAAFAAEPMLVSPGPQEEPKPGYALRIDGKDTGVQACIMVPLRAVAENLGFEVVWNGDGTIFLDDGTMHSTVTLGEDLYQVTTSMEDMVGMSAPFSLGMAPCAIDETTYVPLGLFDALLGSRQGAVTMEDGAICLDTDPLNREESVQIPSSILEYETMAEAAGAVGFDLTVPEAVNGSGYRKVFTISGEALQVIYRKGEEETARIRKAPGTNDISGDYNIYPRVDTVSADGIQITMKGDSGKINLATWTVGGYTYSISVEGGLPSEDMIRLVAGIR